MRYSGGVFEVGEIRPGSKTLKAPPMIEVLQIWNMDCLVGFQYQLINAASSYFGGFLFLLFQIRWWYLVRVSRQVGVERPRSLPAESDLGSRSLTQVGRGVERSARARVSSLIFSNTNLG